MLISHKTAAEYANIFGCDEKDVFHTKFAATNANGKTVTGVVCGGWFKNNTVRFN